MHIATVERVWNCVVIIIFQYVCDIHAIHAVGEFGVVYRAILLKKQGMNRPGFVAAVKTMRGT